MGQRDEDTLTSLANRLTRLEKEITPEEKENFKTYTQDKSINQVVKDLLNTFNPDKQEEKAREWFKEEIGGGNPTPVQIETVCERLAKEATELFNNPDLREYVENVRRNHEQVIDEINLDKVIEVGWDTESGIKAEEVIETFQKFLKENKDKITALKIFYDQPYRRRELTFKMIKELTDALSNPPWHLALDKIWYAYDQIHKDKVRGATASRKLTDIVSLLKFELGLDKELRPFEEEVNRRFKEWVFKKNAGPVQFTDDQMSWLRMIKDHIVTSIHFEKDDLDFAPFDAQGGIGKMWQLFGEEMEDLINEINSEIAA